MKKVKKIVKSTPAASKFAVERIAMGARKLYTIGVDHPWWGRKKKSSHEAMPVLKGAIVRVRPPADTSDEEIDLLGKVLQECKVAKVRFEARAQADVLPDEEDITEILHIGHREIVMAMAEKSSRAEDLKQLLDSYLVKAGI